MLKASYIRSLLAAAMAWGLCASAQAGFDYQTLWVDGGVSTSPTGINERGMIVGSYQVQRGADLLVRPFAFKDGVYTKLKAGNEAAAYSVDDINDLRHVVANIVHRNFTTEAWFGDRSHRTTLAVPGAIQTTAYALNDFDVVTGSYDHDPDEHGIVTTSAFTWSARHGYRTFDAPGAAGLTVGWGLDLQGTVVGVYMDAASVYHGFVRKHDGQVQTVDYPGSPYTQLMGINERGDIVGFYQDPSDYILKGFVLRAGKFMPVRPADAVNGSYPYRITDDGHVVGWYMDSNYRVSGFVATPTRGAD
jgi:hypothetical protein